MWHSATTAFRRRRAGEKSSEKHSEKLPEIGEKSDEKSRRVPDAGRTPFWPHFGLLSGRFWAPESGKTGKMTVPDAGRKNTSFQNPLFSGILRSGEGSGRFRSLQDATEAECAPAKWRSPQRDSGRDRALFRTRQDPGGVRRIQSLRAFRLAHLGF